MELNAYQVCVQSSEGSLIPVIGGQASALAVYKLGLLISQARELLPQLSLVVNSHQVVEMELTRQGMRIRGCYVEV